MRKLILAGSFIETIVAVGPKEAINNYGNTKNNSRYWMYFGHYYLPCNQYTNA